VSSLAVISVRDLTKVYGKSRGIDKVNLEVNEGEIYGFIGPNGAGKSTTIKLLLNLIYPTDGSASVFGLDIVKDSKKIKTRTGYVPSDVRYYSNMTALELLKATLAFHNKSNTAGIDELCETFEIEKNKKFSNLSQGNKKKVAIGVALVNEPELIILDEPTNGLDPLMQNRLFETLKERNKKGTTIFVSSHNLNEVQEHCTKAAFIKDGKIIEIEELTKAFKHSKFVTLSADEIPIAIFQKIGEKIIRNENDTISFSYSGDLNELIKIIYNLKIKELTIENTSLESKFLSYYDGGEK